MSRLFTAALALLFSVSAQADPVKDSVTMELAFIKRVFETGYAPLQWKKEHFGFDLQAEHAKALAALNAKTDLTAKDYRQIVSGFLKSTRDYHVGVQFVTTEASSLPFTVVGVNGRYFVAWIETEKLAQQSFPVKIGDEIMTFGGRPVADVVTEIKGQTAGGVEGTDYRLAERYLTKRSASYGVECPNGPIEIEFKRASGETFKRQLAWKYSPETVDWKPLAENFKMFASQNQIPRRSFRRPEMSWANWGPWQAAQTADKVAANPFQIGGRNSYVPELGTKIWESAATDIFHAYIYRTPERKLVGYVRMPHYMGGKDGFAQFKAIIKRFEETTDGLIIDEINNPGGSVFYVLALMSVLSKDPIKVPDHHITLWPAMIQEVLELKAKLETVKDDAGAQGVFGEPSLDGFPINYQFAQSALDFSRQVLASWSANKKFTEPLHLWGADKVNPDPEVNYSKPILVLTNELDFSGGDFFPAILQDNGRAKIFGQRTSGAGGYVLNVEFPSSLGLNAFQFTGSIARRIDNKPIENLGVTPDIVYEHTVNDFTGGFQDYKSAINKAIADLM